VRRILLTAMLCAAVLVPLDAQKSRNQHGRLFPPQDLGLLEAPDRDQWQRPDQIMDALGIGEASVVADLGAGSGWFTVRLARRVGPNGLVYAQDVQPEMLAAISRRVQREGMRNVRPVLGRGSDPRLPARTLDAIVMVEVAHQIEDRVTLFRELRNALKPQGRLGVIDYRLNGGGPGPDMDERVDPDVIVKEAEQGGLEWKRSESFLPYQYFMVFGVPSTTQRK
jgi:predicted methyltransferase